MTVPEDGTDERRDASEYLVQPRRCMKGAVLSDGVRKAKWIWYGGLLHSLELADFVHSFKTWCQDLPEDDTVVPKHVRSDKR